jgi:hypothetical protein
LDPRKAVPSEQEVFDWQRQLPDIKYYQEILEARRNAQISQDETQELIWNLQNKTRWDEYPARLKAVLLKIDSNAAMILPSALKDQAKSFVEDAVLGFTGLQDVVDKVKFVEGQYYSLSDFKSSLESLRSNQNIADDNELTEIPGASLFSQSQSDSYRKQKLIIFNPADQPQRLDLRDYYLAPKRTDVQPKDVRAENFKTKYSLPKVPSEISDGALPPGAPLRRGRVAENLEEVRALSNMRFCSQKNKFLPTSFQS